METSWTLATESLDGALACLRTELGTIVNGGVSVDRAVDPVVLGAGVALLATLVMGAGHFEIVGIGKYSYGHTWTQINRKTQTPRAWSTVRNARRKFETSHQVT